MLEQCTLESHDSAPRAVRRAAYDLAELLANGGGTLLLSGGSCVRICRYLVDHPRLLPKDLSVWQIGQVDERWLPIGHPASNAAALRSCGLVACIEARGGGWMEVLGPADRAAAARRYERWLESRFCAGPVIAAVGVGGDGHTFGVLPQDSERAFEDLFPDDRSFVSYRHGTATDFPRRLTLTPAGGRRLQRVVGVMLGSEKRQALRDLATTPGPPLHRCPARLLGEVAGALHTDQPMVDWAPPDLGEGPHGVVRISAGRP